MERLDFGGVTVRGIERRMVSAVFDLPRKFPANVISMAVESIFSAINSFSLSFVLDLTIDPATMSKFRRSMAYSEIELLIIVPSWKALASQ